MELKPKSDDSCAPSKKLGNIIEVPIARYHVSDLRPQTTILLPLLLLRITPYTPFLIVVAEPPTKQARLIKEVRINQRGFIIEGRVKSKSEIKVYKSGNEDGKLFNFVIYDETSEISAGYQRAAGKQHTGKMVSTHRDRLLLPHHPADGEIS